MKKILKEKFARAHESLENLATELENKETTDELGAEEMHKLKAVVDKVRQILWQMQDNLGQRGNPQ